MRLRPLFWFAISLGCFVAAFYTWQAANRRGAKPVPAPAQATNQTQPAPTEPAALFPTPTPGPVRLLSHAGNLNVPPVANAQAVVTNAQSPLAYRLSNTAEPISRLAHNPRAILLENAVLDSGVGSALAIPEYLRAQGDPGAFIVQARGPVDQAFRNRIIESGASIVSYIPNNAFLVRGSAAASQYLAALPQTQAVLPYEPYFKLKSSLLSAAVEQRRLRERPALNLLLFPDAREETMGQLAGLNVPVLAESPSPFGTVLRVVPHPDSLPSLAALPGVQVVELARTRVPASDLARATLEVAVDTVTNVNYLGLTGSNILVNVNDTGIDATHPDLSPRVFGYSPQSLLDPSGHGTFIAGLIAGDGSSSTSVSNASGSVSPTVDGQFRGMAPGARIFSMFFDEPDWFLQEMVAATNALISNNSWQYLHATDYDLAAASYDAAVRDSSALTTGSQPVTYVFPAGNEGILRNDFQPVADDGLGGIPDTIASPATAKNVITVGALEQLRNITNETWNCPQPTTCSTNATWRTLTDSASQVAGYSSRGNVDRGYEGEFGRFKPDLVAPGSFLVAARSTQWDEEAYYATTNTSSDFFPNLQVATNDFYSSGLWVSENVVTAIIRATAVNPPGAILPIYINNNFVADNVAVIPGNGVSLPVNEFLDFSIGNGTNVTVTFNLETTLVYTNATGNYFEVLRELIDSLGPDYRYESGTSLAAANVSGTLALMHEFFTRRLRLTNSPALMKALLINGARSASDIYDFQVQNYINFQGWGLVNLTNSLPGALSNMVSGASGPIFAFDQSTTNALATQQREIRTIELSEDARNQPLRATLVWTDPPGNPVAGIKLVNDLDLIVTNLDTGDVYFGNDIRADNDFNLPWNTNEVPRVDVVNNVENVFIKEPLGTNYSITVLANRVNVNAVTAHTNDVVQDFALVISSGTGVLTNAMKFDPVRSRRLTATIPYVTVVTNMFPDNSTASPGSPRVSGGVLMGQHVGANAPLLNTNTMPLTQNGGQLTFGLTNQWHFYVVSNDLDFTNAAFVTFLPPTLAVPRMGALEFDNDNATRIEADIDMYVSADPGLTNLSPVAISNALKSLNRGGTEVIAISNAVPAGTYYVGIKSEDQQAAEYGFAGIFSELPFGTTDEDGNQYLLGLPVPAMIPAGTPEKPAGVQVFAIALQPSKIRRVIVTNILTHTFPGALVGTLGHGQEFAVLMDKTCATDASGECITNTFPYIYEDNGEGDIPFSRPSSGPGNLTDFIGDEAMGVWLLNMANNTPLGTGRVDALYIKVEPSNLDPGSATTRVLPPNTWTRDSIDVPIQATNLTICVSGNQDPIELYVARDYVPSRTTYDYKLDVVPPGDCLEITLESLPPLGPGRYHIGVFNPSLRTQTIRVTAEVFINPFAFFATIPATVAGVTIKDDAVTYANVLVTNQLDISAIDVGLLIRHERPSDLAVTLISPNGTRILLIENRGGISTNGLGTFSYTTNAFGEPVFASTNITAFWTNDFESSAIGTYAPGAVFQGWHVLTNFVGVAPDYTLPWLSNNILVLGNGVVSNALPTTNSTHYRLEFRATHAPYLVGTVGWWPFEEDATDIFGGWDGLLVGVPTFNFNTGQVGRAFFGDGVRSSVRIPSAPELDLGLGRGFSVEGWIRPQTLSTNGYQRAGAVVLSNSFEAPNGIYAAPMPMFDGWFVDNGDIDVITNGVFAQPGMVDSGNAAVDINGWVAGTLYTNVALTPGKAYVLTFAYARNPDSLTMFNVVPRAQVNLGSNNLATLAPNYINTWNYLNWQHTSVVFTATAPVDRLELKGLNPEPSGVLFDSLRIQEWEVGTEVAVTPAPIAEWYRPADTPTNVALQGAQFWIGGLENTNVAPGALVLGMWNTNAEIQVVATPANLITNDGWQHVAMTYDAVSRVARLYANGVLSAVQPIGLGGGPIRTAGDLYFGYHPGTATNLATFRGGLDEFGLYERALSDCEVAAIFNASIRGKYGTNVLGCPVTNSVQLVTSNTNVTYTFVHGLTWTNGPAWDRVAIAFSNPGGTNGLGAGTNLTSLVVRPLDPNVALDDFVLSAVTTNFISGMLHFTEDTNSARIPIKFAPAPYLLTNFPPQLVYSNGFEFSTGGVFTVGDTIRGGTNKSDVGVRDWNVVKGPVTVVSNATVDVTGTNFIALARGAVQTTIPTSPGHRYQLTYAVRGPGAVALWNGDIEPLSSRARDLINGNHGAFFYHATNETPGLVGNTSLYLNGFKTNGIASKIELSDPVSLRLTNALTIEGWIRPIEQTNYAGVEQIVFRGDDRQCRDPYFLALDPVDRLSRNLRFHIGDENLGSCGVDVITTNAPVVVDEWQHVAAVFQPNVPLDVPPYRTNELRLYVNGEALITNQTGIFPFRDLDPNNYPGVTIGNRSRYDVSEPYRGYLDDLAIYGRALTEAEIVAIAAATNFGKADPIVAPLVSLAKARVSLDGAQMQVAHGENGKWTTHTIEFTALRTNMFLSFEGLLPGTLLNDVTLTELPAELSYLPEESLNALIGESAFGLWTLEILDTRTGGSVNVTPELVQWQLDFKLIPGAARPPAYLSHGIPSLGILPAGSSQNFVVPVPQWAQFATNSLLFSTNRVNGSPADLRVYMDTNSFPFWVAGPAFIGPTDSGTRVITTNTPPPSIVPGQPYYLTVTNPNPVAVNFGFGVWFDINPLTNCVLATNFVGPAGIPKYFQFDVPTNAVPPGDPPRHFVFWLSGLQTNVTVVLSQHLPLPDLGHYDYISRATSTNDEVVMVLTNTTPWPLTLNRWYVGVFNSGATNVPFSLQACYGTTTNDPVLVPLTNDVPFFASLTNQFVAPPGPPRTFFFEFQITNYTDAVLFELYNLSGDADLLLHRYLPSANQPYYAGSFRTGLTPEQIVLRPTPEVPDLRGSWYLGVYNNDTNNTAYTLRAVVATNGVVSSGQLFRVNISPAIGNRGMILSWNAVVGERYVVERTTSLRPANWQAVMPPVVATTPFPAVEVPVFGTGSGFYRVTRLLPGQQFAVAVNVQPLPTGQVRVSWPIAFTGYRLQYADSPAGPWQDSTLPITVEGNEYVVYDAQGPTPRYYRAVP